MSLHQGDTGLTTVDQADPGLEQGGLHHVASTLCHEAPGAAVIILFPSGQIRYRANRKIETGHDAPAQAAKRRVQRGDDIGNGGALNLAHILPKGRTATKRHRGGEQDGHGSVQHCAAAPFAPPVMSILPSLPVLMVIRPSWQPVEVAEFPIVTVLPSPVIFTVFVELLMAPTT